MTDIASKLGGNFFVAAFVPTLGFVALGMVIFGPVLPPGLASRLQSPFFGQAWLTILVWTIVLGYILSSLNTFIYKVFEGYMFLARFSFFQKRVQCQFDKDRKSISDKQNELIKVEAAEESKGEEEKNDSFIRQLRDEVYYMEAEFQQKYPRRAKAVLPTAFGNILRAAEDYPSERYGIDSVVLWPRLIYVMPESYFNKVDEGNNSLGFLVNCCLLSILTAILSLAASGYEFVLRSYGGPGQIKPDHVLQGPLYFIPITEAQYVYDQRAWGYLIIAVFMLLLAFVFYRGSLPIARRYGNLIRSAYDLFRFELLKQLNLSLPQDLDDERHSWQQVSELLAVNELFGPLNPSYRFPANVRDLVEETEEVEPEPRRYKARKAKRSSASRAKRSKT